MMSLVPRRYSVVSSNITIRVATLFLLSAIGTATQAQVDYYYNPPTGVDTVNLVNTWDLTNVFWNSVNQTTTPTANNYTWLNNGNERANFGNTAGTVTLSVPITAYGINFASANYALTGGVGNNALTLAGAGGVISNNSAATITAPIGGSVGLTKTGSGALTLNAANTYSGTTSVSGGTLIGNPQVSGSPFSSGAVTLAGAILNLKSTTSNTTTTSVGNLTISAANANTVGASNLTVDNTGGGPTNTTTFAASNLIRGGSGSALVITPQSGFLGSRELITFTNGSSLVTNGIMQPWLVTTTSGSNLAADFVTYGSGAAAGDYNHNGVVDAADYVLWRKDPASNGGAGGYTVWAQNFGNAGGGGTGVSVATYSSTDLTTSTSSSVVNQSSVPSITGNVAAYALKTNQVINLGGNTLTLGNGSGQSGLILNSSGSITGGNVTFGNTEGILFAQGTTTLGGSGNTITSNGLNVTALGLSNVTLGGNIVNGSGSAFLNITAPTSGSSVTLGGANTYTGGTTLSVNTSTTGNVFVGSDSAFGIGKVTNIIVPGTSSDQLQASGGDRTLANAFDLNGGMNFTGTNNFTFTGPLTIINSAAGGSRTLGNLITTSGKSVTLGSSGSPSTITLGNPVANGGDGVGKLLGFSANASSTTVINDVMQDPAAGGGAASGSVTFGGSANGVTRINSQNTYSGATLLGGASTVQIGADSVGTYPSITSGPFGVGTLTPNNGTNNPMQPVGGSRTIANPILMNTGFLVSNAASDPSAGITFTGPITFTNSRTLNNGFTAGTGGTLTLGSSGSPSTITLAPTVAAQNLQINSTGTTVVNDSISDTSGFNATMSITGAGNATFNGVINTTGLITISAGGGTGPLPSPTILFNAMNTFTGGLDLTGGNTLLPVVNNSNALPGGSFTAGPFGTGPIKTDLGTNQHIRPVGANRSISNQITMNFGMAMDNATGESFNLTFAGPIVMVTNGRFISNGFVTGTTGGTMIMGDPNAPSTITLPTVAGQTLSFSGLAGPIVVNDVIQDATGASGNVQFNPNAGNNNSVTLNAANIYTGNTTFANNGLGNVQLGVSTVGDFGSITSGPFGTGTVLMASTSATPPSMVPFGAARTVSNAITLNGNLGAANSGAQTFNLNLTGPVSLGGAVGRSIINNMAGTLTIGQSTVGASTNPVTLSGTAAQSLTFNGAATSTTVVNDVIQNGGSGLIPGNVIVAGGIAQFNNANTYGPTTPGTSTNTTVSGGKLLVNNTSGSGTGTGNVLVTGGALGGNGTISQSVSLTGGAIAPGNSAGLLTVGGGVTFTGSSAFNVEIGGTSAGVNYDQLVVGGIVDLSAASSSTFNVSLINAYAPPSSPLGTITDFTVLTATGGITGTFGNLAFPDGNWTAIYSANSLVARYIAPGPGAGALAGGATVPEPTAMALLICAAGSVVLSSSRVSRRRKG